MRATLGHGVRRFVSLWRAWPFYTALICPLMAGLEPPVQVQNIIFLPALQGIMAVCMVMLARGVAIGPGGHVQQVWPVPALPLTDRARSSGEGFTACLAIAVHALVGLVLAVVLGLQASGLVIWGLGAVPLALGYALWVRALGQLWSLVPLVGVALGQALVLDALGGGISVAAALSVGLVVMLGARFVPRGRWHRAQQRSLRTWRGPLHSPASNPVSEIRRQLWRGLVRDCVPGLIFGLFLASFFVSILALRRPEEYGSPSLIADGVIALLAGMAMVLPNSRRHLPTHASLHRTPVNMGFLAAYRALPLPQWLVLRRLVAHSAYVSLACVVSAGAVGGVVTAVTGQVPLALVLLIPMPFYLPLSWSLIIPLGTGNVGQLLAMSALGLAGFVLILPNAFPPFDSLAVERLVPLVVGLCSLLVAVLLPVGALRPPPEPMRYDEA